MKYSKTIAAVMLVSSLALVQGCGGGTTNVQTDKTQGQELIDLKSAFDQGIITEREYDKAKSKILKR
ncbi:MAG: SHOCT domain-containing protein [Pseudomonadales bacterium]